MGKKSWKWEGMGIKILFLHRGGVNHGDCGAMII